MMCCLNFSFAKRVVSLIFLVFLSSLASAGVDNKKLIEANSKYMAEDYETAVKLYEEVLQTGESAAAYYNLAGAHYKLGHIAKSILNYERALVLDPENEDARYNLELVKELTVDKIETIEPLIVSNWINSVRNENTSDGWAVLSIVVFLCVLVCVGLFFFVKIGWLKRLAFFSGIVLIPVFFVMASFASTLKEKKLSNGYAIVLSPSVTIKGSPEQSAKDVFILHEGTKVKIKQSMGKWFEIQLEDGQAGWILKTDAEAI